MEIITQKTKKHKDGVAVIPWSFIAYPMPPEAKLVHAYLNECEKFGTNYAHPTFRKIAFACGLSYWKATKAITFLEKGDEKGAFIKIHSFELKYKRELKGEKPVSKLITRRTGLEYEILRLIKLGKKDPRGQDQTFEWE